MRYSIEPKYRKYIQGYGFLSFAKIFGDKYDKKLIDTAAKTELDAANTDSKRIDQKTAEAIGDLIGNKIADKITSLGKSKNKEKKNESNEVEQIYIPPEKRQQIVDELRCFRYHIKMKYQTITNLLGNISDKVPTFIAKKWIEVHDQTGTAENKCYPNKQIRFKISILRTDLRDYSDAYIVVTGPIAVTNPANDAYDKKLTFKNIALFISCISKISNTLIDNAEHLDIVMPV